MSDVRRSISGAAAAERGPWEANAFTMKRPDTAWQQAELAELFTTCVRGGIPLAREQLDLILRIVRRLVPNVQTVLDLGCGDGVLGRMLLSEYPQARCAFLDFSQPMLDLARKAIARDGQEQRSQLLLADLGDAAWTKAVNPSHPFDVVLSGFCIHHQPDSQKRRIYKQVFELLKPGGLDRKSTRLNSSHSKQSRMPSSACCDWSSDVDRKSTRLNSSHSKQSRMPSSA